MNLLSSTLLLATATLAALLTCHTSNAAAEPDASAQLLQPGDEFIGGVAAADADDLFAFDKRAPMDRSAMVRFGKRAGMGGRYGTASMDRWAWFGKRAPMDRSAMVRFGKRAPMDRSAMVRFGKRDPMDRAAMVRFGK